MRKPINGASRFVPGVSKKCQCRAIMGSPGDIHYFSDQADLDELLAGFKTLSRECEEGYWENQGEQQFYSIWHIVAEKK